MKRMKPVTTGRWQRVGRNKHYRHESNIGIVYVPNKWLWEIVGGPRDGERYERLWAAQHAATKHLQGAPTGAS